ncbi:MAG: DUF4405 domain-containing protein [Proteobacteria bacterium]|nr:DUF4405 domain-containing protein [Pseudomonadota bacterium]
MAISRNWVTPIAGGAFLLSAVTGVLIFFHLDSGLNKLAHEWLSWLLLGGVVLHVVANLAAFKRHYTSRVGAAVMGGFAVLLVLSFVSVGARREPPFMASVRALSDTPLTTLALVAGKSPAQVRAVLAAEGLPVATDSQSLGELAGPDMGKRMRLLKKVLEGRG